MKAFVNWKNLSIRKKIGSGFIIVIGITVATGIFLLVNLFRISQKMEELSNVHIPTVYGSNQLMRHWLETSEQSRAYDFTGNPHFKNQTGITFSRLDGALHNLVQLTQDRIEELEGKGVFLNLLKSEVEHFNKTRSTYEALSTEFHERRQKFSQMLTGFNNQYSSSGYNELRFLSQFNSKTTDFNQYIIDRKGVEITRLKPDYEKIRNNLRASGASGEFLRNGLSLSNEAIQLVDLYQKMRIAELKNFEAAKSVMWEVRASSDIGLDQIMVMGNTSNEVIKQQRNIQFLTLALIIILGLLLIWVLSNSIGKPIAEGIAMAEKVAAGDLTVSIKSDRTDEVGRLATALNKMTQNLNTLILDIIQTSHEIISSSETLNNKAMELAEGANQQASSAEEVSSSMEEMHANIQQNTENSRETESISTQAAKAMIESNEKAKEAAQNLEEITSKISIIKDIAFQTNILALNAAVEAARAGQEGRGFSVVAAEVRKLAERTQVAAQEITKASGITLNSSNEASELIEGITPQIEKTAGLIREISAASIEQVTGVEQINLALQELNQVTQRNAANADDISNAAQELQIYSKRLARSIKNFKANTAGAK